jgi:hypothetical protein
MGNPDDLSRWIRWQRYYAKAISEGCTKNDAFEIASGGDEP